MNQIDLEGYCAVITGGAQGIGRAVAERLLASGAAVSLWDQDDALLRTTETELRSVGRVHMRAVDVADASAVQYAADETAVALGKIDILVANAGITGPNMKTWEYSVDAWQ